MTIFPPNPILPPRYLAIWTLTKGYAIDGEGNRLSRNETGIPILDPGTDDTESELSYFHSTYEWTSVDLTFDVFDGSPIDPLINYTISAQVYRYEEQTTQGPNDPEPQTEIVLFPTTVTLESLSITSSDPNNSGTWIFPDDYDVVVDANHPKEYGGVILFGDTGPKDLIVSDKTTCGIDDGPNNNGIVRWISTLGILQENISGYNYIDVFDRAEFEYIPRNVGSNSDEYLGPIEVGRDENFRFQPLFDEVVDPEGRPAPIYPMDMITKFLPDGRDSVDVTYTAVLKVKDTEGNPIQIDNGTVTINQTCTQDVDDYSRQLNKLFQYCNYYNPLGIELSEFSPTYPYDYPYTNVNGFEGLGIGEAPVTRGRDVEFAPLKRGDVWYNPATQQRMYYSIADRPETLTIIDGGDLYRTQKEVPCVWEPPESKCQDKEIRERERVPYGLLVDIITKDGEITQVTISNSALPSGFQDGDLVKVTTGAGNATLRINIKTPSGWTPDYIEKYYV